MLSTHGTGAAPDELTQSPSHIIDEAVNVRVLTLPPQHGISLLNEDADAMRCGGGGQLLVNEFAYVRRHSGHALARCVSIDWPIVQPRGGVEENSTASLAHAHVTLWCGTFEGTLPSEEAHRSEHVATVLLSPAADRRIASLLGHKWRGGAGVALARFHDEVVEAATVVLSTPEDAVGDVLDEHWVLSNYVAPHFLDVRRVVSLGEHLCLPFRDAGMDEGKQGGGGGHYPHTRMFCVVHVEASVGGVVRPWPEGAVTLSDQTSVRVVQACRGPMRAISAPLEWSVVATDPRTCRDVGPCFTDDSTNTTFDTVAAPPGVPTMPQRQPSPSPAAPLPAPSQLCNNTTQTERDGMSGGLQREHWAAAAEAKEQRMCQLIRDWSAAERQRAEADDVLQTIAAAAPATHRDNDRVAVLDADVAESGVLDAVRIAYRATSHLRAVHNDVRRFLKDPGAHPSRGNVICFERLNSTTTMRRPLIDGGSFGGGRSGFAAEVRDGLQQWLRTHLGIVCISEFRSFDDNTSWVTVSEHSVQKLADSTTAPACSSSTQHQTASHAFLIGCHDNGTDGELSVGRWSGQVLRVSIVEALCRRREHARQQWLAAVDALRPLETYAHALVTKARALRRIYTDVCECLGVAAIDPQVNPEGLLDAYARGERGAPSSSGIAPTSAGGETVGDAVLSRSVLALVDAMRGAHQLVQSAVGSAARLPVVDASASLRDCGGLRGPLSPVDVPPMDGAAAPTAWRPCCGTQAKEVMDRLDEAYTQYRSNVADLLVGDNPQRAWASLHRLVAVHQERMVLLHRMERRVVVSCGILVPFVETFLPLIAPCVASATDHRSFPELLRYLTASAKASTQAPPAIQAVEQEVATFQHLVARAGAMPLIPLYQLLSNT